MLDPYKMVFINCLAILIFAFGILIYKRFYPKSKLNLLLILTILSTIVCISIFRKGVYESGDFMIHSYRSIEFFRSVSEGNLLPSWAAELNAGYGYPLFIFNYPLPYYVIIFFHFIGFSFITSMKLFLAVNFILSGIFMYWCANKLFKNELAAFTTAVFYQFVPYHLIDLHFKNVIGEIMIFTCLPLVFFSLQKLWEKRSGIWLAWSGITTALLIMSHVVLALFAMGMFFFYTLSLFYETRKKHFIFSTIAAFILGSLCSVYIWLTPFFLTKYTLFNQVTNFVYFPQWWELLFAPWRMGFLYQGSHGELSFLLGYTQLIVIGTLLVFLFRKKLIKKTRTQIIFWLFIFGLLCFLIMPYSKFLWGIVPFLKITGSHRLLVLTAFVSSLLAGYLAIHLLKRKMLLFILIAVTILATILNWGHRRVIPEITEDYLLNSVATSTTKASEGHFYANSKWRSMKNPWFKQRAKKNLEINKGSAESKELTRSTTKHTYIISAKTNVIVKENTLYFPGWQAFDNGKEISAYPDKEGLINFKINKGLHFIELKYQDIMVYRVLKIISISVFLILLGYLLFAFIHRLLRNNK